MRLPHDLGVGCDRESTAWRHGSTGARQTAWPSCPTRFRVQVIDRNPPPGGGGPAAAPALAGLGSVPRGTRLRPDTGRTTRGRCSQRNAALQAGQRLRALGPGAGAPGRAAGGCSRQALLDAAGAATGTKSARRLLRRCTVELELSTAAGARTTTLAEVAATAHRARDRERGSTGVGRASLRCAAAGRWPAAREVLSRGQQKLLGAAMALAMAQAGQRAQAGDAAHAAAGRSGGRAGPRTDRRTGRAEIAELNGQLVVTALRSGQTAISATPERVFHVEQGRVKHAIITVCQQGSCMTQTTSTIPVKSRS